MHSLKHLLSHARVGAQLEKLARHGPDYLHDEVRWRPVIPQPGKILCVGLNYLRHAAEGGREKPPHPVLFVRFASSVVGHEASLVRPSVSDKFDFEGELAVVIGKRGRHVDESEALSLVAGYSCFNDGSVRDWQRHTSQFTPGKNFVASGAFGPWLVMNDEISDPAGLTITTRLNGSVMQRGSTDEMLFSVPRLISYISTFTALEPGDVIVTGTPEGVGAFREPPVFLSAGDVIEIEISQIGRLTNPVRDEARG